VPLYDIDLVRLFVVAGGLIVAGALVVRGPRPGSGAENAGSSAWTLQRIRLLLVGAAWMIFGLVVALQ
jgi:hypothetical protein